MILSSLNISPSFFVRVQHSQVFQLYHVSIITANVSDFYISSNFTDYLPELSACDISYELTMCELRGLGLKLCPHLVGCTRWARMPPNVAWVRCISCSADSQLNSARDSVFEKMASCLSAELEEVVDQVMVEEEEENENETEPVSSVKKGICRT